MKPGTHTFLRTRRVHFGAGSLDRLGQEAGRRVFVITGRTLDERTDLVRRVEGVLGERHAGTFAGMGEHTPGSAVEAAAEAAEGAGCDTLVSVGGGSAVDGAKAVARQLAYPEHVAVPTTLSGAEWAQRVGVTDEAAGRKAGFADPETVPGIVILDPETTAYTPERLWLSTGIRALDHAVEGILYGREHPVTDVTGAEAARRLVDLLPRSKTDPDDLDVRGELQVAAWLSYFGPLNTPMGLSHDLGRRLGASYGVPHGITSCITLAPSLEVMRDGVRQDRWDLLSRALGGDPPARVAALVDELGLPSRLDEVGVPAQDIDAIAGEFGDQAERVREILRRA